MKKYWCMICAKGDAGKNKMLENIINSGKNVIKAFGLALSLYSCGDTTIINNYLGRDGGRPVPSDVSKIFDSGNPPDSFSPNDAQQDTNTLYFDGDSPDAEIYDSGPTKIDTRCTYSGVSISINDVVIDWRKTWGKITDLELTISNNSPSTINSYYALMTVEGYDDFQKVIPLPPEATSILSCNEYNGLVEIPRGFSYSEVTTGDLSNVGICLELQDVIKGVLAYTCNEFNLDGFGE